MNEPVSIIMPAYNAQPYIVQAVQSVLAQTHPNWELIIIADDLFDYAALLTTHGIHDPRIRHASTGQQRSGASAARNVGLALATHRLIAPLDGDDAFAPTKLARCVPHVAQTGIVACALDLRDTMGNHLRTVGTGVATGILAAADYKRVNLSADSMLVFDRERLPVAWDTALRHLNDMDLLIRCFADTDAVYHIAEPLHIYRKVSGSISNSADTSNSYERTKRLFIERIDSRVYRFQSAAARDGIRAFLTTSLAAEQIYPQRRVSQPDLLFEDLLEPMLGAAI